MIWIHLLEKMTKHKGLLIFLVASVLLVSVAVYVSFQVSKTQSAMRAFIDEEGTWAKAHRDAMMHFQAFTHSEDPSHINQYHQRIHTNTRIIEAKSDLDQGLFESAEKNLIAAGCHPDNVKEIIFLYHYFSWLGTFQHAMGIWDQANVMVYELDSYIKEFVVTTDDTERQYLMRQIEYTQGKMIEAEKAFEADFILLANYTNIILNTITGLMYFFVAVGLFLVIRRTLNQLTEKEELYDATFNKSRLAYVQYAMDGRIIEGNQRFADMVNTKVSALPAYNFFEMIKKPHNESSKKKADFDRNRVFEFVFTDGSNPGKYYKANTTTIHNYLGTPRYCVAAIDDITEETRLKQELEKKANHDFLTDLLNKRAFENILTISCVDQTQGHVMFMDLNQFKRVNDVAGHHAGDHVLKAVCQRISGIYGLNYFSRIGGDEFAAFIKGDHIDAVINVAEDIISCVKDQPFEFEKHQFNITISIGISQSIQQCPDKDELIKQADAACYLSKKHNKVIAYHHWADKA